MPIIARRTYQLTQRTAFFFFLYFAHSGRFPSIINAARLLCVHVTRCYPTDYIPGTGEIDKNLVRILLARVSTSPIVPRGTSGFVRFPVAPMDFDVIPEIIGGTAS